MSGSCRSKLRLGFSLLACMALMGMAWARAESTAPGIGTQDFRRRPVSGENPITPPADKSGTTPPKPPVPPPSGG